MSTASNNPPTPSTVSATPLAAAVAASSSSSSPARPLAKSSSPASAAAAKPSKGRTTRRKPVKRRGARAESESEEDGQPGGRADDSASDSDSDFAPSLHQSEDDEEDDSDEEEDGATEPKTPANASIEQLQAPTGKAVLAGHVTQPSWSDMPDVGEEGASELPTLDFANLSLDAVEAVSPIKGKGRAATAPKDSKVTLSAEGKSLSKKQLALQRREAKDAALKARDPGAWEAKQEALAEKELAKKAAKKERAKERRKAKKEQEKAGREGGIPPVPEVSTSGGAPSSDVPTPSAKPARPVVPSRPSRTGLAYGLVNSASPAPAVQPIAASSTTPTAPSSHPIVPAFRQQPAFVRAQPGQVGAPGRSFLPPGENWRGRGGAAMRGAVRGRGRGGARFGPDRWAADGTVAGEAAPSPAAKEDEPVPGVVPEEKGGRGEPHRQQRPTAVDCTPNWSHAGFEELEAEEKARSTTMHSAAPSPSSASPPVFANRGRGRGRGGFAGGRGSGILAGPPGAINPRYAHLPFHPLHRYPAVPTSTPTAPASTAPPAAAAPPPAQSPAPVAGLAALPSVPQVPQHPALTSTTAANDQDLFDEPAMETEKPAVGVRLPSKGAAQIALAIKGAAAARAKEEGEVPQPVVATPADAKENEPVRSPRTAAAAAADLELRKQQGASILYAADPTRFAALPTDGATAPLALHEQHQVQDPASSLPLHLSGFMHQVPPHLQSPPNVQAPFIPRHDSPVYYPPQPFYSPDAFSILPSPGITPPPLFPSHAPPSSAYFLPPRANKRVEIKAPSRDGQSPVPIKPSSTVPSQQQPQQPQQQAPSWQQRPPSSFGSPNFARAPLPPTSPALQPQNPYGAAPPPQSSYYGYNQYDAHPAAAYEGGYYGMHAPPPATQHTYQQPVSGAYNPYAAGPSGPIDSAYGAQAYYDGSEHYGGSMHYGGSGEHYGGGEQHWGMY
ncbi:hypothetical protein JCM11251_000543 [Rhodosporidiobolus azoricus]